MAGLPSLLLAVPALFLLAPALPVDPAPKVAVLSISLNNIHKTIPDSSLPGRIARLGDALRSRLGTACGYDVVPIDPSREAAARVTDDYLYEHPGVAAELARPAGADWVIVPRLNRATAWVADLQAHVIRVRDTMLVSNRIVELKGLELGPELAARLTERGAAWMADQISQAIELSSHPDESQVRRCPPHAT